MNFCRTQAKPSTLKVSRRAQIQQEKSEKRNKPKYQERETRIWESVISKIKT